MCPRCRWNYRPLSVRGAHRDRARSDRPRVYRARDRIRRQRLRVAQDDPYAVLGGLLTVLGDQTCAVIEAPRAQGRGSIPRSPDGGNRRRFQPRVGIRSRIADRLRAPALVDQGLTTPPSHRASNVSRRRLRLEVGLAILSVLLFFATLLWPEWIEIVFGVDPDFGNGSLEWLTMELTAISAVVAIFLARADWRRIRSPGLRQP